MELLALPGARRNAHSAFQARHQVLRWSVPRRNAMIDIIVPCYNSRPELLAQCLASIAAQETQYHMNVWIVDDGSKSPVVADAAALHPQFGYVFLWPNGGLPEALNAGHVLGSAKYCCWISDDNWFEPNFVEEMIGAAEGSGYELVRSLENHVDAAGVFTGVTDPRTGTSALPARELPHDGYLGASHLYRRSIYERTDGYDPEMAGIEDLDMYYQLMGLGARVGFVDRSLYNYRVGTSSFSEDRVRSARVKFMAKWGLK